MLTPLIRDVEFMDIKGMHSNGMSIADIALKTGYSEKTIRKWLRSDDTILPASEAAQQTGSLQGLYHGPDG